MSHADNSREKLMKKYTKSWLPHQANLIYMVSKHSIIYVPLPANRQRHTKLDKAKLDDAWIEISTKLDQPILGCKQLWSNIKLKYTKIMSLINKGRITKMAALSHPETGRFLDGRLSFMDPYLSEIGDEKIPFTMHKLINNIFGLKTKQTPKTSSIQPNKPYKQLKKVTITHAQVKALLKKRKNNESDTMDTKSLQIVIDTVVKSKLDELLQIKNTLSNLSNDIVNNDDENAMNVQSKSDVILIPSDEENTSECITKWDLGLQSELIIKEDNDIEIDHEDDEQRMEDDEQTIEDDEQRMEDDEQTIEDDEQRMEDDEQGMEDDVDNIEMNDEVFNINKEDKDGLKEENSVIDKNLNNETFKKVDLGKIVPIIVPDACTILGDLNDEVSDAYIKNFFKQLGVVMSLELNISKQKKLKSRINELLKSILVSEEAGLPVRHSTLP